MATRDQLKTARKLGESYKVDTDKVITILDGIPPDGNKGSYDAWLPETFEEAWRLYRLGSGKASSEVNLDGSDGDIGEELKSAKLRIALAQAEEKELNNLERKNQLVLRVKVEALIRYQSTLFAGKLRELTAGIGGDDKYNQVAEEISKDLQSFIIEEDIENIVSADTIEEIELDMLDQEKQDFEI